MKCGTLTMKGSWVLEWFLNTFQSIMNAYESPVLERPASQTVYTQYTENWKRLQDDDRLRQATKDSELKERESKAMLILEDRKNIISQSEKLETQEESPISTGAHMFLYIQSNLP